MKALYKCSPFTIYHSELGQNHPGLLSNPQPMVRLFISPCWFAPRTSVQVCCGLHRCLQHRLGSHVQWVCSSRGLDGPLTALTHQLPLVASSTSCSETPQNAPQLPHPPYGGVVPHFELIRLRLICLCVWMSDSVQTGHALLSATVVNLLHAESACSTTLFFNFLKKVRHYECVFYCMDLDCSFKFQPRPTLTVFTASIHQFPKKCLTFLNFLHSANEKS